MCDISARIEGIILTGTKHHFKEDLFALYSVVKKHNMAELTIDYMSIMSKSAIYSTQKLDTSNLTSFNMESDHI